MRPFWEESARLKAGCPPKEMMGLESFSSDLLAERFPDVFVGNDDRRVSPNGNGRRNRRWAVRGREDSAWEIFGRI